jgi:hypothetical protein
VREIPKWARRYAQNRTLRILVLSGILIAGAVVFVALGRFGGRAFRSNDGPMIWASLAAIWVFAGGWLWFALVGAPRLIPRITRRLYRGEGSIFTGGAPDTELPRVPNLAIGLLILLATVHILLIQRGVLPERYFQPVSALYVSPFMLWVGLSLRPQPRSSFMCLWPVLYVVHGVLIVAGAPISRGLAFDIFAPAVGYGFLAALAGHLYSRLALRRLRSLAVTANAADEADGGAR